jgi:hypothetical protein
LTNSIVIGLAVEIPSAALIVFVDTALLKRGVEAVS